MKTEYFWSDLNRSAVDEVTTLEDGTVKVKSLSRTSKLVRNIPRGDIGAHRNYHSLNEAVGRLRQIINNDANQIINAVAVDAIHENGEAVGDIEAALSKVRSRDKYKLAKSRMEEIEDVRDRKLSQVSELKSLKAAERYDLDSGW